MRKTIITFIFWVLFPFIGVRASNISSPMLALSSVGESVFKITWIIMFVLFAILVAIVVFVHCKFIKEKRKLIEQLEISKSSTVNSGVIMWEWFVNNGEMVFSDSFYVLTGYEPELFESSVDSFTRRVHKEDVHQVTTCFENCLNTSVNIHNIKFRFKKNNGEYIWFKCISKSSRHIDYKNSQPKVFGILLDVTKEVENENLYQEENQIVATLMKFASIKIWMWNLQDGIFKFIINNDNSEDDNIQTLEDFFENMCSKDVQRVSIAISDYINNKTSECYVQFRDKEKKIWYELLAYTFEYDSENKPYKFIGLQRDITERKRLNELYRESQKMETISRLAGGMAHDFNNILQVIHGFTDLAMLDVQEDSEEYLNLQHVLQGAAQAEALVEQLLTFSKDDINRPFPLVVADALSNYVSSIDRKLKELKIDLSLDLNVGEERIYADPNKLDQLLSKLIDNSLDAIDKNGKIRIKAFSQVVEQSITRYGLNLNIGKYIVVSVQDNGSGIERGIKPLIFDPFFTTKDVGEGRGLGLSTVYNCVKASNGFIKVYSYPNFEGSKFDIYFPIYDLLDKKTNLEISETIKQKSDSKTILVVDDYQMSIDIIKKYLNNDYVIFETTNCNSALDLFSSFSKDIDLVIIDCVMNNINGVELYKKMLEIKPDIPVIFISGFTKNDLEKQFGEKIDKMFLSKPIQQNLLVEAVNKLI
ncbi:MAG: PAS domain-containing protein [Kiritimatiellae bacterium]|nr:PAS domain-containing protein [Kiritimatiellia bacterium]